MKTDKKRQVVQLAHKTTLAIRISGLVLIGIFGFLRFGPHSFSGLTIDASAAFLFELSLVLYFTSYFCGTLIDSKIQTEIYLEVPGRGRFPLFGWIFVPALVCVFGLLCWVSSIKTFLLILLGFWFVDHIAWMILIWKLVKPSVEATKSKLQEKNDLFGIAEIEIFKNYMMGKWKWIRSLLGICFIFGLIIIAHSSAGEFIASGIGFQSVEFLYSLLTLIVLILLLGWNWYNRIKVRLSFGVIEILKEMNRSQVYSGRTYHRYNLKLFE